MKNLRSLLRAVFGDKARRPRPRQARPHLEGLEGRWTPANLAWDPQGGSTDWLVGSNWVDLANGQRRTDAPADTDTVTFDGSRSNGDCDWSQALSGDATLCHSLIVQGDYAGHLSLDTHSSTAVLTITDNLSIAGNFAFDLDLGAGNKVAVGDEFYWTGQGAVDRSDANDLATITAHHIHWVGESKTIGANVTTTGADGNSTINLDEYPGAGGEYTLYLDKGAVLENGAGTLTHNRGTIDDTSHADHEHSHVVNASGATWMKTTDTTTTVSMTFVNAGLFHLVAGTYIIDDYSSAGYDVGYYQAPTGTTQIDFGATLQSTASPDSAATSSADGYQTTTGTSEPVATSSQLDQATADGAGTSGDRIVSSPEAIQPPTPLAGVSELDRADQGAAGEDVWGELGVLFDSRLRG